MQTDYFSGRNRSYSAVRYRWATFQDGQGRSAASEGHFVGRSTPRKKARVLEPGPNQRNAAVHLLRSTSLSISSRLLVGYNVFLLVVRHLLLQPVRVNELVTSFVPGIRPRQQHVWSSCTLLHYSYCGVIRDVSALAWDCLDSCVEAGSIRAEYLDNI